MATATAERKPKATGHEMARRIRDLRIRKLGIDSRPPFARLLGVAENTIARWESGQMEPRGQYKETLLHLDRLCEIMASSTEPKALADWVVHPQAALENFRPIDLIGFEYGRRKLKAFVEETGLTVESL